MKVAPVASYGIQLFWQELNITQMRKLERVKTHYLKITLGASKYSKNRFIYLLTGEKPFIMDVQERHHLEETESYKRFKMEHEAMIQSLPTNFYSSPGMKSNSWKQILAQNRRKVVNFSINGYHHIICLNNQYHEPSSSCICKLCHKDCSNVYHYDQCSKRPGSFLCYNMFT